MKIVLCFFMVLLAAGVPARAEEVKPLKGAKPMLEAAAADTQEKSAKLAAKQKDAELAKLFKKYPPSVETKAEGDRVRIVAVSHPDFPTADRGGARSVRLETGSGLFLDGRPFSPQGPFGRAEFIVMPAGSKISKARIVVLGVSGGSLWRKDLTLALSSPKSAPQGTPAKKPWPWSR